jgi:hypothetical protein
MCPLRTITWFIVTVVAATAAHSHGTSFLINLSGNKLTLAGGIADPNGFAPMVFADGTAEAQLQHVNEPGFGNIARTDQPGFVIEGLPPHSGVSVDFIRRPVQGTNPVQERLLWHWSAATQAVSTIPNDLMLTVAAPFEQSVLDQAGMPLPFPLFSVHLPPEEIGVHLHYLNYILEDNPAAPTGAYGFFARFIAEPYTPTDPFLVVLNNGLDANSLRTAALAINAAASDRVNVVGDYNNNGSVDAGDYVVWRNTLGSKSERAADGNNDKMIDAADYAIWRASFGRSFGSSSLLGGGSPVPEPASIVLAIATVLAGFTPLVRSNRLRGGIQLTPGR